MRLHLPTAGLERYKSLSQRARVATESWAESNLFCPNCTSNRLTPSRAGTPAIDYLCPNCDSPFQLKSASRPFASRIMDAAYSSMVAAIRADRTPNLFALHYDADEWSARNLFLIPRFAFPLSAIHRRKPLADTARRAGWVGCDILLDRIPTDARILIITNGAVESARSVRRQYGLLRPLAKIKPNLRGWTLDVLTAVRSLGKQEFSLPDAYSLEKNLSRLHPANSHIRPKIRQQLQILRDAGLLTFLGNGRYSLL